METLRAERAALEAERTRLEEERRLLEAERAAAERDVAESIAAARAEIEKLEAQRAALRAEGGAAVPETEPFEDVVPEEPPVEPEEVPVEPEEVPVEPEQVPVDVGPDSPEPDFEVATPETVVDLGQLDTAEETMSPVEPEPALAGATAKSGLMGAVRAAFSKNSGREHVHEFVEAPAGLGIVRSICSECGYVSISTSD